MEKKRLVVADEKMIELKIDLWKKNTDAINVWGDFCDCWYN